MEVLKASSSASSFNLNSISTRPFAPKFLKQILHLQMFSAQPVSLFPSLHSRKPILKLFTAISSTVSTDQSRQEPFYQENETKEDKGDDMFDWYAHWYPVMPICDLDKRRPHGKKVLGIDIVVWWDRNEKEWKVFEDSCPHRLAPLSEGRIDQWGRLQCVYHGWCFGGSGDCKFIPQAPRDGPPIHTSSKACVAVYPSCVQNKVLWFWPNADPKYKDIFSREKPPYIPEIDDPSFVGTMITRDIPYGYEVLIENLMDPSHVAYAHYGIMRTPPTPKSLKADREGGKPFELNVKDFNKDGFTGKTPFGFNKFVPPCLYYGFLQLGSNSANQPSTTSADFKLMSSSSSMKQKTFLLVFMCIPVSPGNSRLIFTQPRNVAVWLDKIVPRWIFHIGQNLILDSDLYLLHVEERKIREIGSSNWQKACYVPTKADAYVVTFRRWLNKYCGGEVEWKTKFSGELPPTPPREQLMDRYWSHTVKCSSCNSAYKYLNAFEVVLQVMSIASIGVVAARQGALSLVARYTLVSGAILCFVAGRWLSYFIHKTFRFHDYDHAFR